MCNTSHQPVISRGHGKKHPALGIYRFLDKKNKNHGYDEGKEYERAGSFLERVMERGFRWAQMCYKIMFFIFLI
jgi:hypothetical protein